MSFGEAEELQGPTGSLIFKNHATVRIASGGNDALPDLIVGDGQGKLWWLENRSTATAIRFAEPQHIVAGERQQWGNGYTGATLADVNADQLPDLLVAHSNNQISIHLHVGRQQQPVFAQESLDVTVQNGCQGRFDVADWDGDGLLDLIVGGFDGALTWHHNSGTSTQPRFEPAVPFHDIKAAYNAHPRVVDFDRSGSLDLLLGINWGTVTLYRNIGSARVPRLSSGQQLRNALGATLNIRQLNSDDTTPELCDLNRDGVLDPGEPGIPGVLVTLSADINQTGQTDYTLTLSTD
ncbi:MAG: FG-GAP-like repeat-containing protein, partial [Planctomycetaceae bacterium]